MEILQIKNLNFSYPKQNLNALKDISLSINKGDFVLICGQSGCGKTTLLKMLKREISPFGQKSGSIYYNKEQIEKISDLVSASEFGFVGQNPDEQIVTDKVWHELAFGLENLGVTTSAIRRRVGEMASYFGIKDWYDKNTDDLSGGQKQLLNLASVMVMQPKILMLDEPTSQLDPIAASDFIATLKKLNSELGLTVILAEHAMEDIFSIADKVVAMEKGQIIFNGLPKQVSSQMRNHRLSAGLPSSARIWAGLNIDCDCPLTVKEGRTFLETYFQSKSGACIKYKNKKAGEPVLQAKGIYFRYEKNQPDVLRDFDITAYKGEFLSILGGNGSGKTTALNIIAGLDKPYRGKLKIGKKKVSEYKNNTLYRNNIALLPQNPQTVFLKETVREDYEELLKAIDCAGNSRGQIIKECTQKFGISDLLDKHPYDLSGGEQQKCALAKVLLTNPKILLLDEPTKGFDAFFKRQFSKILDTLKIEGITIIMVTHDVEFAAEVSDRCALLFDGELISQGTVNEFFSDNNFYTTAASRISRDLFKNTVLCEEVINVCSQDT